MKNILFALALIFSPVAALAADAAPSCNADAVGTLQCMAGKECECKFFNKSAMAGTPERFGWDCGINRGPCIDHLKIDSTKPYDGPQSVIIDKRP